ncbi:hypothetical protein HPB51_001112 [Rhipicephalus microplus]|uniref:Fibrinogen C-terminal domain-containing protein n=1 Tax=Rhipicephalus microplus TaxID=6941 RepID=A0A9J6EVM2_RHIMP|nr:hypothetical protein HPB51_001112 [Rhipicephalus microplus]
MAAGQLHWRLTMLVEIGHLVHGFHGSWGWLPGGQTDIRPTIEEAQQHAQELAIMLAKLKTTILPRHCTDLLGAGQRSSGVYTVFHKGAGPSGQSVYCDMDTDGGGWTVSDPAWLAA